MPDDEQKKSDPGPDQASAIPEEAEATTAAEPEEAAEEEDKFRPGAIAARVDRFGEESDVERIAREEEKKLQERRKGKKGKKGALEAAASKRLAKIGEVKVKRPSSIADAASGDADPLLERTMRFSKWVQEHRQTFGGVVVVALLGAGGFLGYNYWQGKHEADASAMLAQAFADERGKVSDKADEDDDDKPAQLYPTFKTQDARRDAALAKYREVETKFAGTGAAILARLAEAGLLLDARDGKGAAAAYEDVKSSTLAQADAEVRGRAVEGVGFADELLAESDAANKDHHLDDALAAFKQLEQVDMKGFKELGEYHEARVFQAKGDKAKAIELLKDVHQLVSTPGTEHPFPYLEVVSEDRLRGLDPTALPPKAPKGGLGGLGSQGGAGPGGLDMSDPKIQELLRQLQQQGGGAPAGLPPGPPPGLPPGAPK